jgi:hypothetical protein
MRRVWILFALLAGLSMPAVAQEPLDEQDTTGAELLRQEIERRFADRVRQNLGLNDDQMTKLRATNERYGPRRRQLIREWLGYELALRRQMRPGVAANSDSVRIYMDGQQRVRAAQLALDQDVDKEMASYLTPVQRAQYHMMWRNFLQRVNELRQGRQNRLGGQRPFRPRGQRPGVQPGAPRRRP